MAAGCHLQPPDEGSGHEKPEGRRMQPATSVPPCLCSLTFRSAIHTAHQCEQPNSNASATPVTKSTPRQPSRQRDHLYCSNSSVASKACHSSQGIIATICTAATVAWPPRRATAAKASLRQHCQLCLKRDAAAEWSPRPAVPQRQHSQLCFRCNAPLQQPYVGRVPHARALQLRNNNLLDFVKAAQTLRHLRTLLSVKAGAARGERGMGGRKGSEGGQHWERNGIKVVAKAGAARGERGMGGRKGSEG
eukprot:357808-Chlamydomonas_euryale.AAC.1